MGVATEKKRRRLEENSCCQQLLSGGEGGRGEQEDDDDVGLDLISRLPDDVLGEVITLLPTKDGGRTQVLSRRWRLLWRSAPLNLEVRLSTAMDKERASAILRSHRPGHARRLSMTWSRWFANYLLEVNSLLRSLGLDSLQELELYSDHYSVAATLKPSVSRFAHTLRVLVIYCKSLCRLDICMDASSLGFSRLEQLTLKRVCISENALLGVLSRCPVLRSLVLEENVGYRRLQIRSFPELRSLAISNGFWLSPRVNNLGEVIIEDAPQLERLIILARYQVGLLKIRVIHAPKLKILGYLGDSISEFEIGTAVFKNMVLVGPSINMHTVKILAIRIDPNDVDVVIDFLKCFPCLKKLYMVLEFSDRKLENVQEKVKNADRNVLIECLDAHLNMVELKGYWGRRSEVSLIRFFLSKARVLESFKFMLSDHLCNAKWIAKQRKSLRLNIKASQGARFYFELDNRPAAFNSVPMKHIHDLARDDPFDTSSCACLHDESRWFK
ncbi:hypothetical protein BS78_07G044200 [Paspalum vaginatum]|nr:hypothetical protein BS78_07G044200 [Paspalum vaginatum]